MKLIFVYILLLRNKTHYTGITNNIVRRLLEHNHGYSRSTRYGLPVMLIYVKSCLNRKKARRLEVHIKNLGAKKYLNKLKFSP